MALIGTEKVFSVNGDKMAAVNNRPRLPTLDEWENYSDFSAPSVCALCEMQ